MAEGAIRGVRNRPMAMKRYVNGAEGEFFFQKRAPESRPEWIETVELSFPSGRTANEVVVGNRAQLAWVVNLGCIDLNPHPVRADDLDHPDELRVDLDPMPGHRVAADRRRRARRARGDGGLRADGWPKTSGSRGIHVYTRIERNWTFPEVRRAALALAREVERRAPDIATSKWWKEERHGVFLDYNQNAKDRTVASAVLGPAHAGRPRLGAAHVGRGPRRATRRRSRWRRCRSGGRRRRPAEGIDEAVGSLEPLLELSRQHEEAGFGDAPWPPQYAKAEGEPRRVQPSKRKAGGDDEPRAGRRAAAGAGQARRPDRPPPDDQAAHRDRPGGDAARGARGPGAVEGAAPRRRRRLEPADVLVDAMRGRFTPGTRIRVNLEHVPEEHRPEQEALEVDYDPWEGVTDPRPPGADAFRPDRRHGFLPGTASKSASRRSSPG